MTDFPLRSQIEEKGLTAIEQLEDILKETKAALKKHDGYLNVWTLEGMFTAQARSLTDSLNNLVRQDMMETMSQKQGNITLVDTSPKVKHYCVAIWNDDEVIPDMPNLNEKFNTLEQAKIEWGKDNVVVYAQNDGDFVRVSYGQYDPDLDAMVWEDVAID